MKRYDLSITFFCIAAVWKNECTKHDIFAQGIMRAQTFLVSLPKPRQHFTFLSYLNVKTTSVCSKAVAFRS